MDFGRIPSILDRAKRLLFQEDQRTSRGSFVEIFGKENIKVIDINSENIGFTKFGVNIVDGKIGLLELVEWCDTGLITGSTIVNGTIDEINDAYIESKKSFIFYGNSISGVANLMDLPHICPFGR